ncbi:MAG: hypothetical protein GYB67_12315 [Chloroflexi bacterium]|nr:hypothetical protein [Chloroflexota bacterium]
MPVDMEWLDDDKTMLCFTFYDPWTLHEFFEVQQVALEAVSALDHKVHGIFDFHNSTAPPNHVISGFIGAGRRFYWGPNEGLTIAIGTNRFLQAIANIVAKYVPSSVHVVPTLDDARALIAAKQSEMAPPELPASDE